MNKIVFTAVFCIISIQSFGQTDYNLLKKRVYEIVLLKEGLDSEKVKIDDIPIFLNDIVQPYKELINKPYSINRISTLSSPSYYLIVIVHNNKFTFIDMDKITNLEVIQEVVDSFKNSEVSKEEMILYISEILKLLEVKNKDTIRW